MGSIKHAKTSPVPNPLGDTRRVGGGDWNSEHVIDLDVSDINGLEERLIPVDQVEQFRDDALAFRNEAAGSASDAADSAAEAAATLADRPTFTQIADPAFSAEIGFSQEGPDSANLTAFDKFTENVSTRDKSGGPSASGSANNAAVTAAFATRKLIQLGWGIQNFAAPIALNPDEAMVGDGRRALTLRFPAGQDGVTAYPSSTGRNALSGIRIESTGLTKTGGAGLTTQDASFGFYQDISIWGFDVGLLCNGTTGTSSFSARNIHWGQEFNSNNIGMKAFGSNANTYVAGRHWNNDTGLDVEDSEALCFVGTNIEASLTTALKVRDSSITMISPYFEVGVSPGRKNFDFDADSIIRIIGGKINGARGIVETWNPNTSRWHLDAPDTSSNQALLTDVAAASDQYVRNPDFSRGLNLGWIAAGGLVVTAETSDFESGIRAAILTPVAIGSYYETSLSTPRDAKIVSLGFRFKPLAAGTFRINVVNDGVVKAQYNYVSTGAASEYLTGTVTAGATVALDTTKPIFIRIYPDVVGGVAPCLLDQIWAVRGYWVSAPRAFKGGSDLLETPQVLVSGTITANTNTVVTPIDMPPLVKGMRVRVRVSGTAAGTYVTRVVLSGKSLEVGAFRDAQIMVGEFSVVGVAPFTVQAVVTNAANSVTYSVEIVEWLI